MVRAVRRIRGIVDDDVPTWVDMGYLSSIAVAAAVRTGIDVKTTALVWQGRISLPTVGQFEVADDGDTRVARLRTKGSSVFLEAGDGERNSVDEVRSIPLRVHHSTADGRTMRWTVDDMDPYREFTAWLPPKRLAPADFENWCRKLDHAWEILVEEHADYVPELLAVEPVIVPAVPAGAFVARAEAKSDVSWSG